MYHSNRVTGKKMRWKDLIQMTDGDGVLRDKIISQCEIMECPVVEAPILDSRDGFFLFNLKIEGCEIRECNFSSWELPYSQFYINS